jgi:hypothetical protein
MSGPNRYTEGLLEHADVVGSTLAANGEIRVNLGDSATGSGIDRSVPFWGTDGFLSRPADPDANGAAQFVFFVDGNQRFAIGSRDRRSLSEAGTLDPGDRVVYTPSGARIVLDDSVPAIILRVASTCTTTLNGTSLDVVGSGPAEPVALYAKLQTAAFTLNAYVVAAQVLLVKIPVPPTPPELAALNSAYSAFLTAIIDLMTPALASSQVLRASPI